MARSRLVAASLAALALAGCVGPTPYAPADQTSSARAEGYADTMIEPHRWRITFTGNSATSREAVEDGMLYRAAEVTLRDGGDWFRIVDDDIETDVKRVASPTSGLPFGYYGGRGFRYYGYYPWIDSYETREIKRYEAVGEILVMTGEKPQDDPQAYDARAVIANIGPKLTQPKAG